MKEENFYTRRHRRLDPPPSLGLLVFREVCTVVVKTRFLSDTSWTRPPTSPSATPAVATWECSETALQPGGQVHKGREVSSKISVLLLSSSTSWTRLLVHKRIVRPIQGVTNKKNNLKFFYNIPFWFPLLLKPRYCHWITW